MGYAWGQLEERWLIDVQAALAKLGAKARRHQIYAVAFHGFYSDGAQIAEPAVGANSLEALRADFGEDALNGRTLGDYRWSAGDWRWPVLSLPNRKARAALYEALNREALRTTSKHFESVDKRHRDTMIRVAKRLGEMHERREGVFASLRCAPAFVSIVCDEVSDMDDIRRCVPPARIAQLFDDDDEAPGDDLQSRTFQALIAVKSGRERPGDVLPPLVQELTAALAGTLDDDDYVAIGLLGRIGLPHARPAVPVLTRLFRTSRSDVLAAWSARALVNLGQLQKLEAALEDGTRALAAVEGLIEGRPRSYPALERALAHRSTAVRRRVREALEPGHGPTSVTMDDLPAIDAALRSESEHIRIDALGLLDSDNFQGRRDRDSAMQRVLAMFDDRCAPVRARAVTVLGHWGKSARKHKRALRRMLGDRATAVRKAATYALENLRVPTA